MHSTHARQARRLSAHRGRLCSQVLNGVTFVLLQKGRAATLGMYGRYLTGGIDGSAGGAVKQFAKTVGMRFGFCTAWNWFSSQEVNMCLGEELRFVG